LDGFGGIRLGIGFVPNGLRLIVGKRKPFILYDEGDKGQIGYQNSLG